MSHRNISPKGFYLCHVGDLHCQPTCSSYKKRKYWVVRLNTISLLCLVFLFRIWSFMWSFNFLIQFEDHFVLADQGLHLEISFINYRLEIILNIKWIIKLISEIPKKMRQRQFLKNSADYYGYRRKSRCSAKTGECSERRVRVRVQLPLLGCDVFLPRSNVLCDRMHIHSSCSSGII